MAVFIYDCHLSLQIPPCKAYRPALPSLSLVSPGLAGGLGYQRYIASCKLSPPGALKGPGWRTLRTPATALRGAEGVGLLPMLPSAILMPSRGSVGLASTGLGGECKP